MSSPDHIDREHLLSREYADEGQLAARQRIYRFLEPKFDLHAEVAAALDQASGPVLDVGCGNGRLLRQLAGRRPELPAFGMDLSEGMRPQVVGDVMALPVRAGALGAVVGMHMLYHVPDVGAAVYEFARVLRPGGLLVLTTNAPGSRHEIRALASDALAELGGATPGPGPERFFGDGDAHRLLPAFTDVDVRRVRYTISCPEARAVIDYLDSLRGTFESLLPPSAKWTDFLRVAAAKLEVILRTGPFVTSGVIAIITAASAR